MLSCLSRYHLLKLLQKFGKVKQFDFLFHKSGALEGQPRGYCFVNFETKQVSVVVFSSKLVAYLACLLLGSILEMSEGRKELPKALQTLPPHMPVPPRWWNCWKEPGVWYHPLGLFPEHLLFDSSKNETTMRQSGKIVNIGLSGAQYRNLD